MKHDQLINKKFHILQRNKILKDPDKFIYSEIANRLTNSLEGINLKLESCLEIGFTSNNIHKYIKNRFNNIHYLAADISKLILDKLCSSKDKICFDHDHWHKDLGKYDIIISNLYLYLTNDLELLIKNIYNSLNNNGFFVASLPSVNCFYELKKCMIEADLDIYNGAYKRFIDVFSIDIISKYLKANNFKMPVLEIDTIQLKYKNFNNLLNDIRYLGGSNLSIDRKQIFENKNYFKKVEQIYWKNYSNGDEIILQLEIIFLSSWKQI